MISYKGHKFGSVDEFYLWLREHPEEYEQAYSEAPSNVKRQLDLLQTYYGYIQSRAGQNIETDPKTGITTPVVSANDVLDAAGQSGIELDPQIEKSLDNEIARENTSQAQQWEEYMRNTQFTSAANQLVQLGLSPSTVVQTGGATSNGVGAASTSMRSSSALLQQAKLAKYNQRMGMAKQLVGLVGNMASSGIYGHAIGAVKHSAQALTSATAHSGLSLLKSMNKSKGNYGDFYKQFPLPDEGSSMI